MIKEGASKPPRPNSNKTYSLASFNRLFWQNTIIQFKLYVLFDFGHICTSIFFASRKKLYTREKNNLCAFRISVVLISFSLNAAIQNLTKKLNKDLISVALFLFATLILEGKSLK
jgi:hypothetical protein